jgi:hypothetical protein
MIGPKTEIVPTSLGEEIRKITDSALFEAGATSIRTEGMASIDFYNFMDVPYLLGDVAGAVPDRRRVDGDRLGCG